MTNEILFLKGILKERMWGGAYFKEQLGLTKSNNPYGEYWTVSGHPEGESIIKNGDFKGMSLRKFYQTHPEFFNYPEDPDFPILVKIIASNDDLSIQIHPDDEYALEHENQKGKTEGWLILETEKNSKIVLGHNANDKSEFVQALVSNSFEKVLNYYQVSRGMFIPVPSKTLHAIGKGIVLLEIQQSSDLTYRVYDYKRTDKDGNYRPLHIQKSLEVIDFKPVKFSKYNYFEDQVDKNLLWKNQYFEVNLYNIEQEMYFYPQDNKYFLGTVIEGTIEVEGEKVPMGDSFIITSKANRVHYQGQGKLVLTNVR